MTVLTCFCILEAYYTFSFLFVFLMKHVFVLKIWNDSCHIYFSITHTFWNWIVNTLKSFSAPSLLLWENSWGHLIYLSSFQTVPYKCRYAYTYKYGYIFVYLCLCTIYQSFMSSPPLSFSLSDSPIHAWVDTFVRELLRNRKLWRRLNQDL